MNMSIYNNYFPSLCGGGVLRKTVYAERWGYELLIPASKAYAGPTADVSAE